MLTQRVHAPGKARRPATSRKAFLLLVILIVAMSGCSSVAVTTDYDTTADFSRLTAFDWAPQPLPASDTSLDNSLVRARVRSAVERALSEKGYRKTEGNDADFLVAYHVTRQGRFNLRTVGGPAWSWAGQTTVHVDQYDEGTLILDVVAADGRTLLWRGTATARVEEKADPETREARINSAVERMLKRFPPDRR